MKFREYSRKVAIFAFVCLLVSLPSAGFAHVRDEYKFKLHNNTKHVIKKVLVSEDGKEYGYFKIGNGIAAGQTVTLVWDKSTNDGPCHQYFKAVFDNDEESDPVNFDFCEEGLVLEFGD
ncbi:MAG: hypothetical protein DMF61_26745 [Blastocatellia bacterium AA13]|nr:MAG: hypothetical protein DMF61_26745 [Blastocatellia bacterium AA13]